jgi:hypothetical protein
MMMEEIMTVNQAKTDIKLKELMETIGKKSKTSGM